MLIYKYTSMAIFIDYIIILYTSLYSVYFRYTKLTRYLKICISHKYSAFPTSPAIVCQKVANNILWSNIFFEDGHKKRNRLQCIEKNISFQASFIWRYTSRTNWYLIPLILIITINIFETNTFLRNLNLSHL